MHWTGALGAVVEVAIDSYDARRVDKELGGPAFRSRSATAAGRRPVRKYLPLCATRWLTKASPEESQIWELCVPVAGHQMPGRAGSGALAARRLCLAGGLSSGRGLKAGWFAASQACLDDRGAG
jgi:hypothetical protein